MKTKCIKSLIVMMSSKTYTKIKNSNVFLKEKTDGSVSLADFNYPDGKYNVSILDKDGDVISSNNKIPLYIW